ncbi:ubiquitin carboxyl-terminal hydrolase family protein [Babesia bovis T2Bo]|uniref:MINDY deubiquitinase domain-containing protein n=1 Tax=Babesia bovis TaxID=5865 RepID=A7AU78_BABBO|nr:ubiquitin carboxyl-terminal hydrolase family protein [Babesia bovis T2Bo]EDO06489.1 ubiquitin carboxyl-terminal hydrolase family protein [Babesia bovis T2Bo]|eukprot:XP_001610057.1 hypothetical protein [Babesia bovis T2Bo]
MSTDNNKTFNVKWLRHFSRVTPFILYNDAKDSLLVCVANVLFLRRKIQVNQGTETITLQEIINLVAPLVKRVESEWTIETLRSMEKGTKIECPLNAMTVSINQDMMKLLGLLSINLFHGCIAGTRYKSIENFTFDDLRYHMMLHGRGQQMEGVRFEDAEATAADAFMKKYPNRVTEKGLQMIKAEFRSQENCFHAVYHQNRFQTLTYNDENLYVLMADVIYKSHGCFWEQYDTPAYMDDRFKPYSLAADQVKVITPAGTPRGNEEGVKPIQSRPLEPKVQLVNEAKQLEKPKMEESPPVVPELRIDINEAGKSSSVMNNTAETGINKLDNKGNEEHEPLRIQQTVEENHVNQAGATLMKMMPELAAQNEPAKPNIPAHPGPAISLSIEQPEEPPKIPRRTNEFSQAGSASLLRKNKEQNGQKKSGKCGCQRLRLNDLMEALRGRR